MLAFAVLGGDSDVTNVSPSAGSAFGLGLLWGIVGGALGAATALPLEGAAEGLKVPTPVRRVLTAGAATLRPLGALLIACSALGLVGWIVQVGADVDSVRAGRSTATALVEESLYVGEHGVHLAALASGARFTADANGALGLPFPVDQASDVPAATAACASSPTPTRCPPTSSSARSSCSSASLILATLYAASPPPRGRAGYAAQGAAGGVTGPAWAIAMSILVGLAGGLFHGDADGGSVFGLFLLRGAVLWSRGRRLAVNNARRPARVRRERRRARRRLTCVGGGGHPPAAVRRGIAPPCPVRGVVRNARLRQVELWWAPTIRSTGLARSIGMLPASARRVIR